MKTICIGDYISAISEKTTENNQHIVLTSSRNGIFIQNEYFNKKVASVDTTGYKIIRKGQFTYRAMSDTGRFYINRLKEYNIGIVSPAYPVFEVKKNDSLYPEYLLAFFHSPYFQSLIATQSTGSTRVSLKLDKIKKIKLSVPPLDVQRRIAETLDKVTELITLRKTQLEKLDELIKARFVELFGDEQTFLEKSFHQVGEVCESKVGIVIQPTQYYTDNTDNSVKAFRSLNVKPFRVNDSDWVYFSAENNALMCRTQVHTNDVAVVRSGVNLGESCVIPCEYDGCNAIDILILSPGDKILPIYLMAFINYPHGRNQIINAQRGGALKHLNNKQLQEARIFVPPIELQKQFVAFVEQTDKSKVIIQQSLDTLETLKKSLMQEYFG